MGHPDRPHARRACLRRVSLTFFFSETSRKTRPRSQGLLTAMVPTRYLTVVKVLELVGGVLLLSGILVPVGITILTPVIVNIFLFESLIAKQPGPGIVLTLLIAFLIYGYWPYFRSVFTVRARIGGDRV